MAFTLDNAANVLKVRYLGPIREQLNNASILLSRLERDESSLAVSGKSFTIPHHTSRNTSAGAGRADNGTLPTAGQQGYDTSIVPNRYIYGRIQITGPTIRAARDNAGAFVRAVESEIQGVTRDMKKAMNRQLLGDGTDALAYWTGADDASGATVDDGRGNAFVHLPSSGTITCDLIDASDHSTKLGDSIVVTLGAKAAANYALTWTGTVSGSADGDYLTVEDTINQQMAGIVAIIDDADPPLPTGGLQGKAVASNVWWKSQMFANSGTNRDLLLSLMQEPLSGIAVNSDFDEKDVAFMLSNYNVKDKYVLLLLAQKQFVNTMTLDGGYKAIEFNGIPLVPDSQCKRNTIFYIVPEVLKIYRTSDVDWMEKDGSVLSRVANVDAYEATLFHYGNLGCTARNALAALEDISD